MESQCVNKPICEMIQELGEYRTIRSKMDDRLGIEEFEVSPQRRHVELILQKNLDYKNNFREQVERVLNAYVQNDNSSFGDIVTLLGDYLPSKTLLALSVSQFRDFVINF